MSSTRDLCIVYDYLRVKLGSVVARVYQVHKLQERNSSDHNGLLSKCGGPGLDPVHVAWNLIYENISVMYTMRLSMKGSTNNVS